MLFINRINDLLKERNMSIRKLMTLTEMEYKSVHTITKSVYLPPRTQLMTLAKISHAIDVPITELYKEVSEDSPSA